MLKRFKKISWLSVLMLLTFACGRVQTPKDIDISETATPEVNEQPLLLEGESYTEAQDVVNYLDTYGELPLNYLTKKEAQELGWDAKKGNLWEVAPEASIGGDYFGNYEELLPEAEDRDYFEADINYEGGYRNAERLIFSNDGLYFYTKNHYKTFKEMEPGGETE